MKRSWIKRYSANNMYFCSWNIDIFVRHVRSLWLTILWLLLCHYTQVTSKKSLGSASAIFLLSTLKHVSWSGCTRFVQLLHFCMSRTRHLFTAMLNRAILWSAKMMMPFLWTLELRVSLSLIWQSPWAPWTIWHQSSWCSQCMGKKLIYLL